jgi:hypothetical protein
LTVAISALTNQLIKTVYRRFVLLEIDVEIEGSNFIRTHLSTLSKLRTKGGGYALERPSRKEPL